MAFPCHALPIGIAAFRDLFNPVLDFGKRFALRQLNHRVATSASSAPDDMGNRGCRSRFCACTRWSVTA